MSRTELELLLEAQGHLGAIDRHLARTDLTDDTVADAVCLRLAAAIDILAHLPAATRDGTFGHT